ncbi:RCC1-like domain-containing protein [Paenibacillus pasadenensis]|uniref:RCC1-like domain-containing protein n=1 Tax=Paenibacillus TaxID=44249 RepID=UPI000FD875A3|nr:hypothetical protein GE073_08420 [Paenibacillus sp. B01]
MKGGGRPAGSAAAGQRHTVGLRSDGKVVAGGDNDDGPCEVGGWSGIGLPGSVVSRLLNRRFLLFRGTHALTIRCQRLLRRLESLFPSLPKSNDESDA